jgi:hypothetical protein
MNENIKLICISIADWILRHGGRVG